MEQIPFIFPTAREESLVVILSHIASTLTFSPSVWWAVVHDIAPFYIWHLVPKLCEIGML